MGGCVIADVVRCLVEVKEAIERLGQELGAPPEQVADLADELTRLTLVTLSPARRGEPAAEAQPDVVRVAAGPPVMLTVAEMARRLGIGRTMAYEFLRAGRIPHVRFGRVIKMPAAAFDEWVRRETRERP